MQAGSFICVAWNTIIHIHIFFLEFEKCEITIYEEVTKMPLFQRKTLVLIGASGVGRLALKKKLVKDDPRKFGAVMPRNYRPLSS